MTAPTHLTRAGVTLVVTLLTVVVTDGCASRRSAGQSSDERPGTVEELVLTVPVTDTDHASVRAELTLPDGRKPVPIVLIVPGGGNVSRRGTRTSDGETEYDGAVHTSRDLADAFSRRGIATLAWDKRTCAPRDDAACAKYSTADLDVEGPRALAKDVDAACAIAQAHPRVSDVILWAHGQAAQVALVSDCAKTAAAVVLIAAPPRRIDKVLVDALDHRAKVLDVDAKNLRGDDKKAMKDRAHDLRQRALGLDETFKAISKDKFPKEARLLGFPIAYWKGWMTLTDEVPGAKPVPTVPWVVVLGADDIQFSKGDRARIEALGKLEGATLVVVPEVDHHLLHQGALDDAKLMPIMKALDGILGSAGEV